MLSSGMQVYMQIEYSYTYKRKVMDLTNPSLMIHVPKEIDFYPFWGWTMLTVRMAPHLLVFSSVFTPVSTRSKSSTGRAVLKPSDDITVEISMTFLHWFPICPQVFFLSSKLTSSSLYLVYWNAFLTESLSWFVVPFTLESLPAPAPMVDMVYVSGVLTHCWFCFYALWGWGCIFI